MQSVRYALQQGSQQLHDAYRVLDHIFYIVHDIPDIEHDAQTVYEAALHSPRGVEIVLRREGIRMGKGRKKHLYADQEVLEASCNLVLVVV